MYSEYDLHVHLCSGIDRVCVVLGGKIRKKLSHKERTASIGKVLGSIPILATAHFSTPVAIGAVDLPGNLLSWLKMPRQGESEMVLSGVETCVRWREKCSGIDCRALGGQIAQSVTTCH